MDGLISYESMLEEAWKKVGKWNQDLQYFDVRSFLEFGVRSGMAPQVVEPIFTEWVMELASTTFANKHNLRPRETTKSSLINALATFLLISPEKQPWGPQIRIACSAETMPLSLRNSAKIKSALEGNHFVLKLAGSQKPDKEFLRDQGLDRKEWSTKRLRTLLCIKAELKSGNAKEEPSLIATSSMTATTGIHYDVLLDDDPTTAASAMSEVKRIRARHNFEERQNQIARHHLQIILGTRHSEEDLHNTIQTDFAANFNFDVRSVWDGGPELYKDDFVKGLTGFWVAKMPLDEIEILWLGYGQLEVDAKAGGIPADPDERKRRALNFLRSKMDDMTASTWTRNMLNRCIADTDRVFRPDHFKVYDKGEFKHGESINYVLTDAASGRDFRSSFRVVIVMALDRQDCAFVRHVEYGFWTPTDFSKKILDAYRRFPCRGVVLEEMSWRETVEANIMLQAQVSKQQPPRVLIAKGINAMSKRGRVEAMEPRFTNGKILFSPDLKAERDMNGKTKFDEIVAEFMKIQDIDSQPKLKVDVADALSLIDALDEKGQRICRGPRSGAGLTRAEAQMAANLRGENFQPDKSLVRKMLNERSRQQPSIGTGKRSLFGGRGR